MPDNSEPFPQHRVPDAEGQPPTAEQVHFEKTEDLAEPSAS
jgi:hypothetical protein